MDNAIKNHSNSTLRLKCVGLNGYKLPSITRLEYNSLDKTKASLDETLSYENINSLRAPELRDVNITEIRTQMCKEDKSLEKQDETYHPSTTVSRPVPCIGAFNFYTQDGFSRTVSMQGPLIQTSKPVIGACKFLEGFSAEHLVVPSRCGHGCCAGPSGPLLETRCWGLNLLSISELPTLTSRELAAIATDIINNIAWIKSGLENPGGRVSENATNQR